MIEINAPEIEKIEKIGEKAQKSKIPIQLDGKVEKLINRASEAKNPLSYLKAQLQIIKLKKISMNYDELVAFIEDQIERLSTFHRKSDKVIGIEILDGWKGKDHIEIYRGFDNDFRAKEHIKDKDSGEITERIITIGKVELNRMLFIIKNLELDKPVKCYDIAEKLGWGTWKELWKERKFYFEQYYYPIKVFEALKLIHYSGKGVITRII